MITVAIATRNRSKAIAEISLPSLLAQRGGNFDVLVWDASDDRLTESAVADAREAFRGRGVALSYVRAPRKGLSSQRNDAAKAAVGDVVFFIDDDSEVSPDGISVLAEYFGSFAWMKGASLPVLNRVKPREPSVKRAFLDTVKRIIYPVFFGFERKHYRKIRGSTGNVYPLVDSAGTADWLTGACMAFRKSVFDDLSFDERLERFGGYALGEDYDFSHRVSLRYGQPLLVLPSGMVVHHNVEGGRVDGKARAAAYYYNTAVIRRNFNRYSRYGALPFFWELRVGRTIAMLAGELSLSDVVAGYRAYRRARKEDESRG